MDQVPTAPQPSTPPSPQVKKVRIYTMPDKFYVNDGGGRKSRGSFLVIAIVVLVVAILILGAYLVAQKTGVLKGSTNGNTNLGVVNRNANTNVNSATGNVNTNTNTNVTVNRNSNTNTTSNTNSVTNLNSANLNIFPNTNTANVNAPANTNTSIAAGQDSDSDGLTDVEEVLYGTNQSNPDTDGDSFADGQEVKGGYNPNGAGVLSASAKVKLYADTVGGFSALYPSAWAVSDDPQNPSGKVFTSGEEFFLLSVESNPALVSAREWYLTKSPGVDSTRIQSVTTWDKELTGVRSVDGLTVYFTSGTKAYILNYNTNILSTANYSTTFAAFYQSFKLGGAGSTTTVNSNTTVNVNTFGATNTNVSTNTNSGTAVNQNTNTSANTNTNTNANLNSNRL